MRSKVLSPLHKLRRQIDTLLGRLWPSHPVSQLSLTDPFPGQPVRGWNGLYEMVTFRADIGYAAALKRDRWQTKVVEGLGTVGLGLGAGLAGWAGLVLLRRYRA